MTEAILVALVAALAAVVVYLSLQLARLRSLSRSAARTPRSDPDGSLEREKARTIEILDRVEEGVVVFNEVLLPLIANRSARRMLSVRGNSLPPRLNSEGLLSVARRSLVEGEPAEDIVSVWPGRRRLQVRAVPLEDSEGIIVVLQDVTEELRTQQIRRQLVANASHELKSPVASLQALAEAIRQAVGDDRVAAERFSERLVFEAERLGRLIADLLDLSRVEDPANISTTAIDLSSVARKVLEETGPAARAKRLTVTAQVSSDTWVRGDEQQLELLVRNLLDNAVRYTQEAGSVWVDVFREGNEVLVRVADNGLGIPLQAQARVFERFYRVDKDRSRERGGTGLGLSIVKHVAELHGGHVNLQSELGEGSTFTARLPALVTRNGGSLHAPAQEQVDRR
jgi:signal transduction histidine kinase